jgi:transposase
VNAPQRPISLAQKLEIEGRATRGESDRRIALAMGSSRWTVRKWRRRVQAHGRPGLSVRRGRPRQGALSTYPPALRETLKQWRRTHPGWGPATLLARLKQDPNWRDWPLPARSPIARFLREEELTRPYQRHSPVTPTHP